MKLLNNHALMLVLLVSLLASCGGEDEEQGQASTSKGSIATITFENGEVLSTRVICNLKPQMAAGQEILYTATSTRNPYFDVTVFGPNSMFKGGEVSWAETEDFKQYQTQWASISVAINSDFTISLQGETITGSGTFVRGDDETGKAGEKRQVKVIVNCTE